MKIIIDYINFIYKKNTLSYYKMTYNLLTINNITKICNDNFYLGPDNRLTQFQWYDFQLQFIIDNIDFETIPNYKNKNKINFINPVTKYKYTRNQIYNNILKEYNTSILTLNKSISKTILKKFGLLPIKIENTYSLNSLGGVPKEKLQLNNINYTIITPTNYLYLDETADIKDIIQNPVFNRNAFPRITKEIDYQRNIDNYFLKLGKFDWKDNSCYADSIILPIIYYIIQFKDDFLYKHFTQFKYTQELLKYKCPLSKVNSILDLFKDLIIKIEKGEMIHLIDYFLKPSISLCKSIFSENYTNKQMFDPKDILHNILGNLYNLEINNCNILKIYNIPFSKKQLFDNFIQKNNFNLYSDINKSKDIDSNPELLDIIDSENEETINKNIISNIEVTNTIFIEMYRKIVRDNFPNKDNDIYFENQPSINTNNFFLDKLSRYYIKKKEFIRKKIKNKMNFDSLSISEFLVIRIINNFSDNAEENSVYKYKPNYEEYYDDLKNERLYYNIKDKNDTNKYLKSKDIIEEHGYRIGYNILEYRVNENSNYIFFSLNRKNESVFYNYKIENTETIVINSNLYNLNFIILFYKNHYLTVIKLGDLYYLYDDNFNVSLNDSYLTLIGDYNSLNNYKYSDKDNICITNNVIVFYHKNILHGGNKLTDIYSVIDKFKKKLKNL